MMPGSDQAPEFERSALEAYRRGDMAAAYDDFLAARAAYDSSGRPLKAAEMANNLCVVLVQLGRGREAVWVVQGTAETFTEGGDLLSAARASGNLASALEAAGDLEAAATAYQQALEGLTSRYLAQAIRLGCSPEDVAATLEQHMNLWKAGDPPDETN